MTFVRRASDLSYIQTEDGGKLLELTDPSNSAVAGFSTARAHLPANTCATPHWHKRTEEVYVIISGRAQAFIGGQRHELGPGDALCIPTGCIHYLENATSEPVDYLAICCPPYAHDDMIYELSSAPPTAPDPS